MTLLRWRDGAFPPVQAGRGSGVADAQSHRFVQRYLRAYQQACPGATIHRVKAYRIERIKSGMKFTCTHCAHSVSTFDFDAKAGNLRTQAATAINDHAAKAHSAPIVVSSDGQQRSWR
jgi:uncharacterized protein (DUF2252 family)